MTQQCKHLLSRSSASQAKSGIMISSSSFFGRSTPSARLPSQTAIQPHSDTSLLIQKMDKFEEVLDRQQAFLFSLQDAIQTTREKVDEIAVQLQHSETTATPAVSQSGSSSEGTAARTCTRLPKELSVRQQHVCVRVCALVSVRLVATLNVLYNPESHQDPT